MTTYDFETGSVGNAATLANTGASAIAASGGNSALIDAYGVVSGSKALSFTLASTANSCWAEFPAEAGSPTTMSYLFFYTLPVDGFAVDGTIFQVFLADNTSTALRVVLTAAGNIVLQDVGAAHTVTLVTNITAKYGQTVGFRFQVNSGTTTSNGVYLANYYATPTTAPGSPTNTQSSSAWSLGAGAAYGKVRIGIGTTQTSLGTNGRKSAIDYLVAQAGTSLIANPAAATAPTANAGADQYGQSGSTFSLSGSGTIGTGGGAITSYTWTPGAKARSDMATATITSPNSQTTTITGVDPGWYDFNLVVTQTGGSLSSTADTVRIWVHPPSGISVKPVLVTKATGITREGTATTDEMALYDANNTTLLRWPDGPAGELTTITWGPCGPSNPTFKFDGSKIGTGTLTVTINHYWEDGTTLLDGPYTWSPGAQATFDAGLSPAALTALGSTLSNRRALVSKITATS